ncbi:MAG: Ig-like domain repeat protein [Proteobacteria bacterium]|nr:Ig-like domain repeat protein [Pseudomonadota bacterium]MBU1717136.1 Ig-like domain repeat protein [Pseudomonadota bacterium]
MANNNPYKRESKSSSVAALLVLVLTFFLFGFNNAEAFTAKVIDNTVDVTIMEVEGNYDINQGNGSPNWFPREVVATEFFKTHPDNYDFLVVFTDFSFEKRPDAVAFFHPIKNDVKGIGLDYFDFSSSYGSNGVLQGMIDMGDLNELASNPLSEGFSFVMGTLSHELLHRWAVKVRYENADGNIDSGLIGRDDYHWSFLLDTAGSLELGNRWQINGNGTFTSLPGRKYFSPLDRYLMGLADKSEVPPMLLIENPEVDPNRVSETGVTISGTAKYVTIDDIIAVEGERFPNSKKSQKSFKIGCIYITRPGTYNKDDIYRIRTILDNWTIWFSSLTNGMATIKADTSLVASLPINPGPVSQPTGTPRTIPPEINDGVSWLVNDQKADGSWQDMIQTTERDTAEALIALQNFPEALSSVVNGAAYLSDLPDLNSDYRARKVTALAVTGSDISTLTDELVARQNSDGGWGGEHAFASNTLDTSIVLRSLLESGFKDNAVISTAISFLQSKQNSDGGWGREDKVSDILTTANVLVAFNLCRQDYDLEDKIGNCCLWLLNKQKTNGGFGNSSITIYDTVIALIGLKKAGITDEGFEKALNYIFDQQEENGSWHNSAYETALAINAIWLIWNEPDLSVSSADIAITPAIVSTLPSKIEISAKVTNNGLVDVPAVNIALYEETVSPDKKIAEQLVSLDARSSVTPKFSLTINDGNTHRYIIVADSDNQIFEASESNNIAMKWLYPDNTYDFEIISSEVQVTPSIVDYYQPVNISVKVYNRGTLDAFNVPIKYYLEDGSSRYDIKTQYVDIPAGGIVSQQITWQADHSGINQNLMITVDPSISPDLFGTFNELNETNNTVVTALTVNLSTKPNLKIYTPNILVTPNPALENADAVISATISNDGFAVVENAVVEFYSSRLDSTDKYLIGSEIISSLAVSTSIQLNHLWQNVSDTGDRLITVYVDPANEIVEVTKDDNSASIDLLVLTLPDLAISESSIILDPAFPKEGEPITVKVTVHNIGGQAARNFPVTLEVDGLLNSQTVIIPDLQANSGGIVTFNLAADITGSHTIRVVVDPENLIIEQTDSNNVGEKNFSIQNTDVWLTERYISPDGDGIKDSTEFFFRLESKQTVRIIIIDENGQIIRNYAEPEFTQTLGGNILWDGRNDQGTIAPDGDYQIRVVDDEGMTLMSGLPVTLDTNRSSIIDAVGTDSFIRSNISCMVPDFSDQQWLKDESGIIFSVSNLNPNTPNYPPGLYKVSPDGEDITLLIKPEWTNGIGGDFDYFVRQYAISPDDETIAFILDKDNSTDSTQVSSQIWSVDSYGENLSKITEVDSSVTGVEERILQLQWALDGSHIAYRTYQSASGTYRLWVVDPDGLNKVKVFPLPQEMGSNHNISDIFKWSPDSNNLAYIQYDDGNYSNSTLRVVSLSGDINFEFVMSSSRQDIRFQWLNNEKIIVTDIYNNGIWLLDITDSSGAVKISEKTWSEIKILPDRSHFAFVEGEINEMYFGNDLTWILNFCDEYGQCNNIYEQATTSDVHTNIIDLNWSYDGSKLAFVDRLYEQVQDCKYISHLLVMDPYNPNDLQSFPISSGIKVCGYGGDDSNSPDYLEYHSGTLRWYEDNNSLVGQDSNGIFVINSSNNTKGYIPIGDNFVAGNFSVSPHGKYLSYEEYAQDTGVCAGAGYKDLWVVSSLLNLTVDLRVIKKTDYIELKGIASDLNFSSYELEYSKISEPEEWFMIRLPSGDMMVNGVMAQWVPPSDGVYNVRLTASDKAGNVLQVIKRISWAINSSIVNLYQSTDLFSPNADGVKDSVEVHYQIMDPVHLEFTILDENNNYVTSFVKDYIETSSNIVSDFIVWDGRNDNGTVVQDGRYKITIFDLEFLVEVDNTPPIVSIEINQTDCGMVKDGSPALCRSTFAQINGSVSDSNLLEWVMESGQGANPQLWNEIFPKALSINYTDYELVQNINNKFRLSAFDKAGNKASITSDFIDEYIYLDGWRTKDPYGNFTKDVQGNIINSWLTGMPYLIKDGLFDEEIIASIESPHSKPGENHLRILETLRIPISSVYIQHRVELIWQDIQKLDVTGDGIWVTQWENASQVNAYPLRLRAVDEQGGQHFSNLLLLKELEKKEILTPIIWGQISTKINYPLVNQDDSQSSDYSFLTSGMVNLSNEIWTSPQSISREFSVYLGERINVEEYPPVGGLGNLPQETYSLLQSTGTIIDISGDEINYLNIDTSTMAEGYYPVRSILSVNYDGGLFEERKDAVILVDRIVPEVQIIAPTEGDIICPSKFSYINELGEYQEHSYLTIDGIVSDNIGLGMVNTYYAIGHNPRSEEWKEVPAYEWEDFVSDSPNPDANFSKKLEILGVEDDFSELSVKIEVIDNAGNLSGVIKRFMVDTTVDFTSFDITRSLFSPNADGILDDVEINFKINENAEAEIKIVRNVSKDLTSMEVVCDLLKNESNSINAGDLINIAWDGLDNSGAIVPDGEYEVYAALTDSCGNQLKEIMAKIVVDNTPPSAIISLPQGIVGESVVQIIGTADDVHFANYTLKVESSPNTFFDELYYSPVKGDNVLGAWQAFGLEGSCVIILKAIDLAGNSSIATTDIELAINKNIIKKFTVSPILFSPNNDSKLEKAQIQYELNPAISDQLNTVITVLDVNQQPVWSINESTVETGIVKNVSWSGVDSLGQLVADGKYVVALKAYYAQAIDTYQIEKLNVEVDATKPFIKIDNLVDQSYISDNPLQIIGSISDENLVDYEITLANQSTTQFDDVGYENRTSYLFSEIQDLEEGPYTLTTQASDLGEIISSEIVSFTLDRTPPKLSFDNPVSGAIFGGPDNNVIELNGSIEELNLSHWELKYASDASPDQWTILIQGDSLPPDANSVSSALLVVPDSGLADGVYTFSLYAQDKAGLEGEKTIWVTIDNTPPEVEISNPIEGSYLIEPQDIVGTVQDLHLQEYIIDLAAGDCSTAYQWNTLAKGKNPITQNTLVNWQVFPADGQYCIKLSAQDLVDNIAEDKLNIVIDTTPPEPPVLAGKLQNKDDVLLTWQSNSELDLAGFNLYRDGVRINNELITPTDYLDLDLLEGIYTWHVTAVDIAGGESRPSNEVEIKVDITPPVARIILPKNTGIVSGLVSIKGTAYSIDDFKEYRLYIGAGDTPTSWQLIRKNPLPISYGELATWDTNGLTENVFSIKLEAEDLSGNVNFDQISVTIDNQPPAPPVLTSVLAQDIKPSNVDITWNANTEPDLAGYLLYRNHELANVPGLVVGNLKPYLLNLLAYEDPELPDGTFDYYLMAMDEAGNISGPSNTMSVDIDTHPPHINIIIPEDGVSFDHTLIIKGESEDTDIATVQFQYKSTNDSAWENLGNSLTSLPYITYLDPIALNLNYGGYVIRAVATDNAGNVDPAPQEITVIFTDISPPTVPVNLTTLTNGGDVTLRWEHNVELDQVAGYNIYLVTGDDKTLLNSALILTNTFLHKNLSDDLYTYAVTAIDNNNNESQPSNLAEALVYKPILTQPESPVTISDITISGIEAKPGDQIEIDAGNGPLAVSIHADQQGNFTFDYSLVLGENQVAAQAKDSFGNISKISDPVSIVYNQPPDTQIVLVGTPNGYDAVLTWDTDTDQDLASYNVYKKIDQNWLKVNPTLVSIKTYTDQKLVNGIYLYQVTAVDQIGSESPPSNSVEVEISMVLPDSPFLVVTPASSGASLDACWQPTTDAASYNLYRSTVISGPYDMVNKSPIYESPSYEKTCYSDAGLDFNVTYYYVVTGVDLFNNESEYSNEAQGILDDSMPPPAATIITPVRSGGVITINQPSTPITGFSEAGATVDLYHDGLPVSTTDSSDADINFSFTINEDIDFSELSPDGQNIAYEYSDSDYYYWVSTYDVQTREVKNITVPGGYDFYFGGWSPDGKKIAIEYYDAADIGKIAIYDLQSKEFTYITIVDEEENYSLAWSPDGSKLLINSYNADWVSRIFIYDLVTSSAAELVTGDIDVYEAAWLPEGKEFVYLFYSNTDSQYYLYQYNLTTGKSVKLNTVGDFYEFQLSPNGETIAYLPDTGLHIIDIATNTSTSYDYNTWGISWSPSGKRIACISDVDLYIIDVATNTIKFYDYNTFDVFWSPDEKNLVLNKIDINDEQDGWIVSIDNPDENRKISQSSADYYEIQWGSNGQILLNANSDFTLLTPAGYFAFEDVPLHIEKNIFEVVATDKSGNTGPFSEAITVYRDPASIPDLEIRTDDILLFPITPLEGTEATITAIVRNNSAVAVKNVEVELYIQQADGALTLLRSESIAELVAGQELWLDAPWNSIGQAGINKVFAYVDRNNKILETDEDNNLAIKELFVSTAEGIELTAILDPSTYTSNDYLNLDLSLGNSGPAKQVVVDTVIEDAEGYPVATLPTIDADLAYGMIEDYLHAWSTGNSYAGDYQVRVSLKETDGSLIDEQLLPFTILPDIDLTTLLTTDRLHYGPNEKVNLALKIDNQGVNYIIPTLDARLTISADDGTDLYLEEMQINNLYSESSATLTSVWDTALNMPGAYKATVAVYHAGIQVATDSKQLIIDPVLDLSGVLSVDPKEVVFGHSVNVFYGISGAGNIGGVDLQARLVLIDNADQSIVSSQNLFFDLAANGSFAGTLPFAASNLGLGNYTVILYHETMNGSQYLAGDTFTVIDRTPPVVEIISPENGSTFISGFTMSVTAKDNASGVASVEYMIDNNIWRPMAAVNQASYIYASTWNPTETDEGPHVISFRATDRAGNVSTPVVTNIIIAPRVEMTLSTSSSQYQINEEMVAEITLTNFGLAKTVDLNLWVEDEFGQVINTFTPLNSCLLADETRNLTFIWNVGNTYAGNYMIRALLTSNGEQMSEQVVAFEIMPTLILAGTLSCDLAEVAQGDNQTISYGTTNSGNIMAAALPLRIAIYDESQVRVAVIDLSSDLDVAATISGREIVATTGFALGSYRAVLEYDWQGVSLELATTSFTVIDITPPQVEVISPQNTSIINSVVELSVKATDDASGVASVDYMIDNNIWQSMAAVNQASSIYGSTWNPTETDEGPHIISFRATDRAGNVSTPVVTNITLIPRVNMTLATTSPQYQINEEMVAEITLTNIGWAKTVDLNVWVEDDSGNVINTFAPETTRLMNDEIRDLTFIWNVGNSYAGNYQVHAVLTNNAQLMSEQVVAFEIMPTLVLAGTLACELTEVPQGDNQTITFGATNNGNIMAASLPLRITIYNESQIQVALINLSSDLDVAATISGREIVATTGFALGSYRAVLEYDRQGVSTELASALFTVIDITPPQVEVISPQNSSIINSVVELTVKATDDASGVASVEYMIDNNIWQPMAVVNLASSLYSSTWNPTETDEGPHIISFRAADRAGNISTPVVTNITLIPRVDMTLATASPQYQINEEMVAKITLTNIGWAKTIDLNVWVEDDSGNVINTFTPETTKLMNDEIRNLTFTWNVGTTQAGNYKVHAVLTKNSQTMAEQFVSFEIMPRLVLTGTLTCELTEVPQGEEQAINYSAINNGNIMAPALPLRITIYDETTIRVAFIDLSHDLDRAATISGRELMSTADLALGTYRAALEYDWQGVTTELAFATFKVIDNTPPQIEVISPQNGSLFSETFELTVTATDDSSGVATVEYQLDDSGTWLSMEARDPLTNLYGYTWIPVMTDEGDHLVTFKATDQAGNVGISPVINFTIELCKPFDELTGTIDYQPQPVYFGQLITFPYTLTNNCAKEIIALTVTLQVVDPLTGAMVSSSATTVNLAAASTLAAEFTMPSSDLAVQQYEANLQVNIAEAEAPRNLANAPFAVLPTLDISLPSTTRSNLLVWLNFQDNQYCDVKIDHDDAEHDDDEHDQDKESCEQNQDKGFDDNHADDNDDKANSDDGDNKNDADHDSNNNDDKDGHDDDDRNSKHDDIDQDEHENEDLPCLRQSLLETALNQAVDSYHLVHTQADFERELRNPLYTDILILGDSQPLTAHLDDELREKVYSGTGLVTSGWLLPDEHNDDHDGDDDHNDHFNDSLLGVEFKGMLADQHPIVRTVASPITGIGEFTVADKTWQVEPATDTLVAGWLGTEEQDNDHHEEDDHCEDHDNGDDNNHDHHDDHGDQQETDRHPAIVLHDYGLGRTIYLAFDYGLTLKADNYGQLAQLLKEALAYTHVADETALYPFKLAPLTLAFTSRNQAFDLQLSATYPPTLTLYDQETGLLLGGGIWQTALQVAAGGTSYLPFYLLAPDQTGSFNLDIESSFKENGQIRILRNDTFIFLIEKDRAALIDEAIAALETLGLNSNSHSETNNAVQSLNKIKDRNILCEQNIEKNIHDLNKAVEDLLKIRSTAIHNERLMLDILLRIEEGRWYLYDGPTCKGNDDDHDD